MLRYLAGAGSALLLVAAGFFIWRIQAQPEERIPEPPAEAAEETQVADGEEVQPRRPPAASERTKEQRRFDRADRDNDGRITRQELLQPRRKAFERLDVNRNGSLSFEEWAVRTVEKFARADANRDGSLNRTEYATTAPRPRPKQQNCRC
ncbi:MAG: EF-hand domain-containing protein [Pseudomonadota bacterium]|nr:EF-hand domain-containing protein [Pseudomonadota bacterium]